MTHEEFEKATHYWDNKEQTAMPEEALKQAVLKYIGENNTCALATGTGDYVRCTPIEYSFHDGKFWMFSEGGRKFIGLEKNSHVCLAIYDKYDGFGNLRSLQVTGDGRAFLGGVQRPCCFQEDPLDALKKLPSPMNLICVTPTRIDALFSDFKKDGYSVQQVLHQLA